MAFRGLLKRLVDVCNAVAFAHSKGIVHRDLKPANIMLGPFGETLVVHWGLAKGAREEGESEPGDSPAEDAPADDSLTQLRRAIGTPAYMAPEQARGEHDRAGPAADVYSLGATLCELLVGHAPFGGKGVNNVLASMIAGQFTPPRAARATVPGPLDAVCLKAMAPRPEDRYAGALDLAADVERWLADEPVSAYREPFRDRAGRWARRHRVLVNSLAGPLLVGTAAAGTAFALVYNEQRKTAEAERLRARASASESQALRGQQQSLERQLETESKALAGVRAANARARAALDTVTGEVVGRLLARRPDLDPAERRFLASLVEQYDLLAAEGGTADGLSFAARARLRVAQVRARLGETAAAEGDFAAAVAAYRRIPAEHLTPTDRRDLGTAQLEYAKVAVAREPRVALAALKDGLTIRETMLKGAPADGGRLADVAAALFDGAELMLAGGQPAEAERLYGLLLEIYAPFVARRELGPDVAEAVGKALDRSAFLNERTAPPKRDLAIRQATAAVEIFRVLENGIPDEPRYRAARLDAQTNRGLMQFKADRTAEGAARLDATAAEYRALVDRYRG